MSDAAPSESKPRGEALHRHPCRRPTAAGPHADPLRPGDDVFFAAIELTRMPIVLSDPRKPDNPLIFANQAFLAMTGYKADESSGATAASCRAGERTGRSSTRSALRSPSGGISRRRS